jgi:palmitoyl-protein thioesterase
MWHGMGDTCCNPLSLGALKNQIEKMVPGLYIYSIEIGSNQIEDEANGFLKNCNDQIEEAFEKISKDPKLANGFNAIGFSQGGQFLRAYVQRYNTPKVHNLITMGAQHQGVFGFPRCPGANSTLCDLTRKLLNLGAYFPLVQSHLVQAEYWKDPFNIPSYLKKNVFLPDINNELESKNATYKSNLMTLNKFVMVKFEEDSMVQPRESEWFGFYSEGQDKQIVALKDSSLYTEDWLGLKQMDADGKLVFLSCPGDHLQFTLEYFQQNILPYITQ